jgi:hypothetical protein
MRAPATRYPRTLYGVERPEQGCGCVARPEQGCEGRDAAPTPFASLLRAWCGPHALRIPAQGVVRPPTPFASLLRAWCGPHALRIPAQGVPHNPAHLRNCTRLKLRSCGHLGLTRYNGRLGNKALPLLLQSPVLMGSEAPIFSEHSGVSVSVDRARGNLPKLSIFAMYRYNETVIIWATWCLPPGLTGPDRERSLGVRA